MNSCLDIQRPLRKGGIIRLALTPFSGTGSLKGFGDFQVMGWHLQVFGCGCHRQGESRWAWLPPSISRLVTGAIR